MASMIQLAAIVSIASDPTAALSSEERHWPYPLTQTGFPSCFTLWLTGLGVHHETMGGTGFRRGRRWWAPDVFGGTGHYGLSMPRSGIGRKRGLGACARNRFCHKILCSECWKSG